jgi:hypothetical protein
VVCYSVSHGTYHRCDAYEGAFSIFKRKRFGHMQMERLTSAAKYIVLISTVYISALAVLVPDMSSLKPLTYCAPILCGSSDK